MLQIGGYAITIAPEWNAYANAVQQAEKKDTNSSTANLEKVYAIHLQQANLMRFI